MEAKDTDIKVFYSLVSQQRSSKSTGNWVLVHDGKTNSATDELADAFSQHFQKSATPSSTPHFDTNYQAQVLFDKLLIETVAENQTVLYNSVTKLLKNLGIIKIVSEYDQEIPQSQTADNPMASRGRAAQPSRDTRKTN